MILIIIIAKVRPMPNRLRASFGALGLIWMLSGCASAGGPRPAVELTSGPDRTGVAPESAPRPGILVMAHGGGEEWNGRVEDAVRPLRGRIPVTLALGMANPATMQAALDSLADEGVNTVAVVRLFVSGASFLHPTEFLLGLRPDPPERAMVGHRMVSGAELDPLASSSRILLEMEGLGGSHQAARILVDRAAGAGIPPAESGVLLLAHGMGDEGEDQQVLRSMEDVATALEAGGYAEVHVATLKEDWAGARQEAELRIKALVAGMGERRRHVLVIPYRVSGFGPYAEVLEGLDYVATEGFLPHPLITDWIAARATARFCANGLVSPLGPCITAEGGRAPSPVREQPWNPYASLTGGVAGPGSVSAVSLENQADLTADQVAALTPEDGEAAFAAVTAGILWPNAARAQSRGRVYDLESGVGIADAEVVWIPAPAAGAAPDPVAGRAAVHTNLVGSFMPDISWGSGARLRARRESARRSGSWPSTCKPPSLSGEALGWWPASTTCSMLVRRAGRGRWNEGCA